MRPVDPWRVTDGIHGGSEPIGVLAPAPWAHLCPTYARSSANSPLREHRAGHHQSTRLRGEPDRVHGVRWSGSRNARYPSYPLSPVLSVW
jgi:hypothetical protein